MYHVSGVLKGTAVVIEGLCYKRFAGCMAHNGGNKQEKGSEEALSRFAPLVPLFQFVRGVSY